MFDFVQKYQWLIKVILGLIVLSFLGFGIGPYLFVSDTTAAKVGGEKIDESEIDRVARAQEIPDSGKAQILQSLIAQRLRTEQAKKYNLSASDAQLQKEIHDNPAFQVNGQFSLDQYNNLLRNAKLSPVNYENSLREQKMSQVLIGSLSDSSIASQSDIKRVQALLGESREISMWPFLPEGFVAGAKGGTPDEIKQYYAKHLADYKAQERAKFAYLVFGPDALTKQVVLKPEAIKLEYDANVALYARDVRRASHILLAFPKDATVAQKAKLKADAMALQKEVAANPARFAELAKAKSADTYSAEKGGDLGFFERDKMVKPFSDAAFSMDLNAISPVVESEFGYHIIQLTGIKKTGFEDVKADIEAKLRLKGAQGLFGKLKEAFQNAASESPKSLDAAAKVAGLVVQKSDWIDRAQSAVPELSAPAVLEAIFQPDVVKKGYNSETVDLPDGRIVVARSLAWEPARQRTMLEVQASINQVFLNASASKLALRGAYLASLDLKAGKNPEGAVWKQQTFSKNLQTLADPSLRAVFAIAADKLPAYGVVTLANDAGAVVVRIDKVNKLSASDNASLTEVEQKLKYGMLEAEMNLYERGLKQTHAVKIYNAKLASETGK